MGYKDMTFCTENTCAKTSSCKRFFTEEDRQGAIKWWGNENFPVAVFTDTPSCYEENHD